MILNNAAIIKTINRITKEEEYEGVFFIKNNESIYSYLTLYESLLFLSKYDIKRIRLDKIKATKNQMKDLIDFFTKRGYEVITEEENYIEI